MTPWHSLVIGLLAWVAWTPKAAAQQADKELLGRAIEYFQTEKYHECMLLLSRLDGQYTLNPRFRAFLGVCYYYEGTYAKASDYLEQTIPLLASFSPQERGIYNWLCGESLFCQSRWREAIGYYETSTLLRKGNDKADALYRMGFCYIHLGNAAVAVECMESALAIYRRTPIPTHQARMVQISHMLEGLRRMAPLSQLDVAPSTMDIPIPPTKKTDGKTAH